jgi:16S rRNA G966 N2-methylase RsmD
MTSLAEKEGLKGKVQMIYIDPPFFTGRSRSRLSTPHTFADQWPGGLAE